MKRRYEESDAVPPAELLDYRAWCAGRGVAPYGHDLAVAQWETWLAQRRQWAAGHGVDEADLDLVGNMPWNPDTL